MYMTILVQATVYCVKNNSQIKRNKKKRKKEKKKNNGAMYDH